MAASQLKAGEGRAGLVLVSMIADRASAAEYPRSHLDVPFSVLNVGSSLGAAVLLCYFHAPAAIIAFLLTYTVCGLGLTMGYHRLFAHRSYVVPKWLEHVIAVCGYMAIQRGPIFWVAMHRLHHMYSDIPGKDPHTPRDGLWHVHFGWIQRRREDVWNPAVYRRLTPDLVDDPLYVWMDHEANDYVASFGLLVLSFLYGGLSGPIRWQFDFYQAMSFAVWVGLLNRIALLQAFGLINSVCHLFGTQPFETAGADRSRNNALVALIIFGEGWHNNHHAFASSARHGLRWYQLDIAWWAIWILKQAGLASNVRVPSAEAQSGRRRRAAGSGL